MAKFGSGLNIEFAKAVLKGEINEPFNTADVKLYAASRGWNPSKKYIAVVFPNGSAVSHSPTYRKLFVSIGDGWYKLSGAAKEMLDTM